MKIATRLMQGIPADLQTGAISAPIYQSATYVQDSPGIHRGYEVSRNGNPTRKMLEEAIAALEEGSRGFAFSSGLAATDAVLKLLKPGDRILATGDLYGGTFRLFTEVFEKFGLQISYTDTSLPDQVATAIDPSTKLIWISSPSNPTLKISDIRTISRLAKRQGALLAVDNTLCSPIGQQPLKLDADIVIHSATKYLAGHQDLEAGLVVVRSGDLADRIGQIQNISGTALAPFDSWLTIRGMETLELRLDKQSRNALEIANWLSLQPDIDTVYYPGLPTHKNHLLAKKQQRYFSGLLSFTLKHNTAKQAFRVLNSTRIFRLAESFGGTKSLICHPLSMSHRFIPDSLRKSNGIRESLIRLSVGIEDAGDLKDDLAQALEKLQSVQPKKNSVYH